MIAYVNAYIAMLSATCNGMFMRPLREPKCYIGSAPRLHQPRSVGDSPVVSASQPALRPSVRANVATPDNESEGVASASSGQYIMDTCDGCNYTMPACGPEGLSMRSGAIDGSLTIAIPTPVNVDGKWQYLPRCVNTADQRMGYRSRTVRDPRF